MAVVDTDSNPSFIHIIKDLRDDAVKLFRQEIALAKREVTGKITGLGKNAVVLGIGAFIGLYCLFFFCLFLNNLIQAGLTAAGFSSSLSAWFAPLLMTMLLGIAALSLALTALKSMRKEKLVPKRTLDSIRDDQRWMKSKLQRG